MPEPNITQQTATTATTTAPAQPNPPNPTSSVPDDIVTRVSSISPEQKEQKPADESFDRKEFDAYLASVVDPKAKELLEKAYKSLRSGADRKFQEAAEMRRQAELARSKRPSVEELLKDPEFIKEAQTYASQHQAPSPSSLTEEEWSALSPTEKAQIQYMQQQNSALQVQMNRLLSQQEDIRIKERYKNYDGSAVDQLQQDLLAGRIQATREHLWKVINYEDAVKAAYQLGLQDRNQNIQEKQNANNPLGNGLNITASDEIPERQQGENNISYFKRLALNRLAQRQKQVSR